MLGVATALVNAALNLIKAAVDAGSGPGLVRIYNGTRPAKGGTATTLLAEVDLGDPCAADATSGILTFTVPDPVTVATTGTAAWGRLVDSDGNFVADFDIRATGSTDNGEEMVVSSTSLVSGGTFEITSMVINGSNV